MDEKAQFYVYEAIIASVLLLLSTLFVYTLSPPPTVSPQSTIQLKILADRALDILKNKPAQQFFELGSASLPADQEWKYIRFDKEFSSTPAVFVTIKTYNEGRCDVDYKNRNASTYIRIKNVTAKGFQVRVEEPSSQDGKHKSENISYLAIHYGIHNIGNTTLEVGRIDNLTDSYRNVKFIKTYNETPAIISTIQSYNDGEFVEPRIRNPSSTTFEIKLEEEQDNYHAEETVAYLAIEPGLYTGVLFNALLRVYAEKTPNSVTHNWYTITFPNNVFSKPPEIFAQIMTENGNQNAHARVNNLSNTDVKVAVEEAGAIYDGAHTKEEFGVIAIEIIALENYTDRLTQLVMINDNISHEEFFSFMNSMLPENVFYQVRLYDGMNIYMWYTGEKKEYARKIARSHYIISSGTRVYDVELEIWSI
ncbi:MAG: H-type lectin domain-containing protein [Thermoplasmata archaeon]|nr:H-type lectin domain-containing protein [Thermoplasmata archaeon]